jgi:hypothetical protein
MYKAKNNSEAAKRQVESAPSARLVTDIKRLTLRFYGIKHRCGRDRYYRRVKFGFESAREAAEYMLETCGPLAPEMTIDRINGRKGYEPGNLRYATTAEQLANRHFKSLEQYSPRVSDSCEGATL